MAENIDTTKAPGDEKKPLRVELKITLEGDEISLEGPTTNPLMTLQLLRMAEDVIIDKVLSGGIRGAQGVGERPQAGMEGIKLPPKPIIVPGVA